MLWRSLGQTLVPILAVVAFATTGCATSIAAKYPHLDRRSVCVVPPELGPDATEWIYDENNHPISNFHPDVIDRVAMTAHTVFEYNPEADPKSVQKLPAPHDQLTCRERFSILPSLEPETSPLPEASLGLYVHKSPANTLRVPQAVAKQLASCPSDGAARLGAISYTVNFNVYVTNDGQAVAAYVEHSTLGDRDAEACMVEALRATSWPVVAASVPEVTAAPAWKMFVADGPVNLPNLTDLLTEIQRGTPSVGPGEVRVPVYVVTLPLRAILGAGVFIAITLSPSKLAPAWSSEMNPITRQPYSSPNEYEQIQRLSPQEIQQRRQAHIKATQPQPAPTSAPSPTPQPQPAQLTQLECPRNERFVPERTDNSMGCIDKKGNLRCYSEKHYPCAGVHTHGILHYQEIRRGVCKEVAKQAVRCDGPFSVSGPCGSVSTVECGDGGPEISGIFVRK